jgi:Chalcone and stilbene synthases, C-terminal domain
VRTLAKLQERRAYECRLTPDRALETLDDAERFLCDRGLLTRTTDSALPSLFQACHEEPYAPDSPGFGQWPATKFPWFGRLGARGYPILSVHRGKNLLVTDDVATLLDPICRAEIERMGHADPDWSRLLRHLAQAGPSELEDVQTELGLKPKELKKLRAPLERCGAIVSRSIVYEEPHRHTSELARWEHVHPEHSRETDPRRALGGLLVAAVRAAVVAPQRALKSWFSWQWYWHELLVDELLHEGRLERIDDYLAAAE